LRGRSRIGEVSLEEIAQVLIRQLKRDDTAPCKTKQSAIPIFSIDENNFSAQKKVGGQ